MENKKLKWLKKDIEAVNTKAVRAAAKGDYEKWDYYVSLAAAMDSIKKQYQNETAQANKPYTISYCSRYGYSVEFAEQFTANIENIIRSSEDAECAFDDLRDEIVADGVIDDFGTDVVQFYRWFGNEGVDDYDEYREGEPVKFPACVKAKADEITAKFEAFINEYGGGVCRG